MSELTVLYDADCGFCRWTLAKLLRWDRAGRFRPLAIQSAEGQALLADVAEERRLESWHAIAPDGRVLSAGAALPALFERLPGGRPFAALARRLPRAAEGAYAFVASRRTLFGRLVGRKAAMRAAERIAAREGP